MKKTVKKWSFRILLTAAALVYAFPLFWTFTMSFKERTDIFTMKPPVLPSVWTWQNYVEVMNTSGVLLFFRNSFLVATGTTVIVVLLASTGGYGLYRLQGRLQNGLSNAILMLRMVPVMVLTIPLYLIFKGLGWINSLPALMMCYVVLSLPLAIWLCLGFYGGIPESVYEAAVVDGCSELKLFTRIGFPLISNSIVVVVLQTFFFAWNEMTLAMVLINKDENRTMAVGIRYWAANTLETPYARMAAAGMMCIVPTVIITIVAQKYLVQGFVSGAVKG